MKKKNALFLFIAGGALYVCLELLYRRKSHYSMFFTGGACVLLIDVVCNLCKPFCRARLAVKALIGGLIITAAEFVTGLLVNVKLGMGVWDYSDLPYNLKGQICPRSSILWVILSIPAVLLGKMFNKKTP